MIMQISYIINEISRKWYTEGLEGEEKAMEKENGGFFNPTIKKFWNCKEVLELSLSGGGGLKAVREVYCGCNRSGVR